MRLCSPAGEAVAIGREITVRNYEDGRGALKTQTCADKWPNMLYGAEEPCPVSLCV